MSVVYAGADVSTVVPNLIEAAVFPHILYGLAAAPFVPFPFGGGNVCQFQTVNLFKGRDAFEMGTSDARFPMAIYFLDDVPTWVQDNAYVSKVTARAMFVVAHTDVDMARGKAACHRDLYLAQNYMEKQWTLAGLTYGPFGIQSTTVVPAAFGTIMGIENVSYGGHNVRPEPDLGPAATVGAMRIEMEFLVR